MEQLLVHLVADYYFQSDWMALNKNKRSVPCLGLDGFKQKQAIRSLFGSLFVIYCTIFVAYPKFIGIISNICYPLRSRQMVYHQILCVV